MVHPSITSASFAAAAPADASGSATRAKAAAGVGGAGKKGGAPTGVVELKAYALREQEPKRRPAVGGKGEADAEEAASVAPPPPIKDAATASKASCPAEPSYPWEARALGVLDVYAGESAATAAAAL